MEENKLPQEINQSTPPIIQPEQQQHKTNNTMLFVITGVILFILLFSVVYILNARNFKSTTQITKVSTMPPVALTAIPTSMITPKSIISPANINITNWRVYQNTRYGFTISYPSTIKLYEPPIPQLGGMIPLCNSQVVANKPDSIFCLYHPPQTNDNPNFGGAAVSMRVIEDAKTTTDCRQYPDYSLVPPDYTTVGSLSIKEINGTLFYKGYAFQGATGVTTSEDAYHTFHKNICFEIRVSFEEESPNVYLTPVPEMDKENIFAQLNQMLETFKFITQ
jgi:hypothetical protein